MDTLSTSQNASARPLTTYNKGNFRDKFEGERKELLELAFLGQKEVRVEDTLSGYSGAQTWRVATDRGVFVVKLAHPTLIDREYQNYREYVVDHMHNIARLQGEPIKSASHEWALLKSTFARLRQSQTLLSYVEKKGSVDVAKILNDIFREYGEPWWGSAQNKRITCGVYYDRLLPAHLELVAFPPGGGDPGAKRLIAGEIAQDHIADLEQDVINHGQRPNIRLQEFRVEKIKEDTLSLYADRPKDVESPRIRVKLKSANAAEFSPGDTITVDASNLKTRRELLNEYARRVTPGFSTDHERFTMDYMEYPNPLPYLQKLLDTTYDAKVSLIHGDLNLQNILVEMDASNEHYRQHWLLDFAETGEGPVLLDLQWLEVQVVTWLLAPEILKAGHSFNVLKDVFEGLHNFRELQPHLKAALQTPYSILQEIRGLVKGYLVIQNDWKEYYRGLVIGLIGTLRFEQQLSESFRQVAFLSAATIIRWTEELPSHLEGLPERIYRLPPSQPPVIDVNSVPQQISSGDKFLLRGGGRATTSVQIKANQIPMATVGIDNTGRWQMEISFDKAGEYTLTAHDGSTGAESQQPVSILVLEPPVIALISLPEQIFSRKLIPLRGTARANASLLIFVNEKESAEITASNSGRWHTSLEFDTVGHHNVRLLDRETGAESASLPLTVLAAPTIESNSIPQKLLAGRKFTLHGLAQPNVRVKIIANQQTLATSIATNSGGWQVEISLPKPGNYELLVQDEKNKVESELLPIKVLKPSALTRSIGVSLLVALALLAIAVAVFRFSKPSWASVDLVYAQTNNAIANVLSWFFPSVSCDPTLPKIKIGIAINQSGNYSTFRKDQKIAYEVAETYFNKNGGIDGRCIEFVDDKDLASETTDSALIANAFRTLIEDDHVVAIIGPGLSQQVFLIREMLRDIKTPVLGASTTRLDLVCDNEYFGRVSASGQWYIHLALELARLRTGMNQPKVAIAFASDDQFTVAESNIFATHVITNPESYMFLEEDTYRYKINDKTRNLDQDLANIAEMIKSSDPDMLVISGLTNDGRILIRKLRQIGYNKPIVGGNGLNTPYIFDDCTDCADFKNFFVPQAYSYKTAEGDSSSQIRHDFITAYQTYSDTEKPKFASEPGQFAAQMFTAVQMIVEALRELSIDDADLTEEDKLAVLREELKTKLFSDSNEPRNTVLGEIYLNTQGEVMQSQFYVAESMRNSDNRPGYHFDIVDDLKIDPENAENACTPQ